MIQSFWLPTPFFTFCPPGCCTHCPCSLLYFPLPSLFTWHSSIWSCPLWTLIDVSASGCALPHFYNKPATPRYLGAVMSPFLNLTVSTVTTLPITILWNGHNSSLYRVSLFALHVVWGSSLVSTASTRLAGEVLGILLCLSHFPQGPLGLQTHSAGSSFYMDSGDLNSGPHIWMTITLPTEPFIQVLSLSSQFCVHLSGTRISVCISTLSSPDISEPSPHTTLITRAGDNQI